MIFTDHPALGQAFVDGVITEEHVTLFLRLWKRRELRESFANDLDALIDFARNDWPTCRELFTAWEILVDPIDPDEYAERAHANRGLDYTDSVSHQVLIEILTTSAAWAQLEPALVVKEAELFEADWTAARARLGDAATMADLTRTDSQRRHDAFVILMRQGAGANDNGASVTANIIIDDETFEEEAERRDAEAQGDAPPAKHDQPGQAAARAARRRCETESGLPLSPSDAFDYAIAGHVRLFKLNPTTGDFTTTSKARLFKGAKRLGIIVRDRHCQGDGCDTRAWHCQIDHTIRYEDGGPTTPTNGKPLCGPCHRHKTRLEMLGFWPPGP